MKNRRIRRWCTVVCCMLVALYSFCGCSMTQDNTSQSGTNTQNTDGTGATVIDSEMLAIAQNASYDASNATVITASGDSFSVDGTGAKVEENIVTITEEGTYVVSGTMENGQIIVETEKGTEVQLVLNGASLHFEDGAAIYVVNAGTITLTIPEGSVNTVSDSASYVYTDTTTDEQDAAIYSADDLIINGTGILQITGNYSHGIKSKDTLIIADTVLNIMAQEDAINANDTIEILSGEITISAGDDGMHTDTLLSVEGGTIDITSCTEGLEGCQVVINGGEIAIIASDDAINAANSAGSDFSITINGGETTILAGGDGLDSNGTIIMNGGSVWVSGPSDSANSSVDYETSFNIYGGTIVAAGSSGMAEAPSSTSEQPSIMVYYTSTMQAGTVIEVRDADGNVVVEMTPQTIYQCAIISSPELTLGAAYTLYSDGEQLCEVTLSDVVTMISSDGSEVTGGFGMGMGGFGGGHGNMDGQMGGQGGFGGRGGMQQDDGTVPELPDGVTSDGTVPEMPDGTAPEGMEPPTDGTMPEGMEPPTDGTMPDGRELPEGFTLPDTTTESTSE